MDYLFTIFFTKNEGEARLMSWPSWPRHKTHLPARMTEGGGAVRQPQWDYEHSEIFLMLPKGGAVKTEQAVKQSYKEETSKEAIYTKGAN